MRIHRNTLLFTLISVLLSACEEAPENAAVRPPVTPAWALGHIVWEDEHNTQEAALSLVDGYLQRDIPVNGIIIDSPWQTSYNDFNWDKDRYPEPQEMTTRFQKQGVHTLLWLTGFLNRSESDEDCPVVASSNFDEAFAQGYLVNDGEETKWWKGKGAHVDFTNPEAVQWWYSQLDKAMLPGVDGFKVDQGDVYLGDDVRTHIGVLSNAAFRPSYYRAMFDYANARRPGLGIILARPWSFQGEGCYAAPDNLSIGWCGDFEGDWDGLKFQLENIYRSAQEGYGATGTEVGGFWGPTPSKAQLIRYAQFGAMTACMVNGGSNGPFEGHLAWWHGPDAEAIYRDVVKLHDSLVPYLFSTLVEAHLHGGTLLRDVNLAEESHRLGPDLFTKAITSEDGHVTFSLPQEGEWVDWRTRKCYPGGTVVDREYGLEEFPLFVRRGSVIPVKDGKGFKLMIIAGDKPVKVELHLPTGEGTDYVDCTVRVDPSTRKVKVQSKTFRSITSVVDWVVE